MDAERDRLLDLDEEAPLFVELTAESDESALHRFPLGPPAPAALLFLSLR